MNQVILTQAQVRKIILHAAGLSKAAPFGKGPEAVYKAIAHLGFVQIDTNYVVERAHHHALAARVPGYKMEWLDELLADGRIFESLTYATGYIPMQQYRFSLPVKASFLSKRNTLPSPETNLLNKILDRIAREGPLMVKDFENDRTEASSGWWDWRPSKLALERLYQDGRLMITRGRDFQKIYDLPKNIIPGDTDTTMPTPEAFARHSIRNALQALGVAYQKDINWRARFVKNEIKTELQKMVNEGEVCSVVIEGVKTAPLYMLPGYANKNISLSGDVFILSPFDVLNVYRHRLRDFFNFDYQVECFVPAAKRKYGYFSLPVLAGDTFIARMDAKADRKKSVLQVNNLHMEQVKLAEPVITRLSDAISAFATFNQCKTILFQQSNNAKVLKAIRSQV